MIDPQRLEELQSDDQLAAGPDAVARAHVDALRKRLRTAIPGIVKSFDAAKQTATVQIAIQKLFLGDDDDAGWKTIPPCADVPVFLPGCKGFVLTFEPEDGDECLLVFSDRAIDAWFKAGGVQQPSEYRLHDLSDGFAFVGFASEPNAISSLTPGAMELRTRDGATVVRLEPGLVTLGAPAGAEPAVMGTKLMTYLTALAGAVPAPPPTPADGLLAAHVKVS